MAFQPNIQGIRIMGTLTGITGVYSGILSGNTISGTTIYGNGSNITGINFNQLATTAHTHQISDIINLQSSLNNKFDKSGGTVSGDVFINGNLTILGTATTINTATLSVEDNIITLNSNVTGATQTPLLNAGFEVMRGSATTKTFQWDESNKRWSLDDNTIVNGNLTITGNSNTQGTISSGGTDLNNIFKSINVVDVYTTGSSFNNNILSSTNNTGGTINVLINNLSGLTINGNEIINGNLTTTGTTNFSGNSSFGAGIISGGTDLNNIFKPLNAIDVFVTGSTEIDGIIYYDRNDALSAFTTDLTGLITNGNGTTATGTSVNLGGILTENTLISGGSQNLSLGVDGDELSSLNIRSITGLEKYKYAGIGLEVTKNPGTFKTELDYTSAYGVKSSILQNPDNILIRAFADSGDTESTLQVTYLGVNLMFRPSGQTATSGLFLTKDSGYYFADGRENTAGIEYYADYSTGWTNNSLITKKYVDDEISALAAAEIFITGATYSSNTFTFTNNTGGTFDTNFNTVTGLTINGTLLSDIISATTYQNLPIDVFVTGGTYSNGTSTFTNNTGGTFNVSGYYTGATDVYTTGATLSSTTLSFIRNDNASYSVNLTPIINNLWTAGTGSGAVVLSGSNSVASGKLAVAEGSGNTASGNYSHAEGYLTTASGEFSHAEGNSTTASYLQSHAEGLSTRAAGYASHAEGYTTNAAGDAAHAEGWVTYAHHWSHSEGRSTTAYDNSHAEGFGTQSNGQGAHAEGISNLAQGPATHVEGYLSTAFGIASHVEGYYNTSLYIYGDYSSVGGQRNLASGNTAFVHSSGSTVIGDYSSILGGSNNRINANVTGSTILGGSRITGTTSDTVYGVNFNARNGITGVTISATTYQNLPNNSPFTAGTGTNSAVLGGSNSVASGKLAYAEGTGNTASGNYSHAEGYLTTASGEFSHAEGYQTTASGNEGSHAEGWLTIANGQFGHAEGFQTIASFGAHAEGRQSSSGDFGAHAEGRSCYAYGEGAHAEGYGTVAIGQGVHAEGDRTYADRLSAHAEGYKNTTVATYSHVQGAFCYIHTAGTHAHAGGQYSIASANTAFVHSSGSTVIGDYSSILGGSNNRIIANVTGTTILGGSRITGTTSDTVYGVNFNARNNITGNNFVFSGQASSGTIYNAGGYPIFNINKYGGGVFGGNNNGQISGDTNNVLGGSYLNGIILGGYNNTHNGYQGAVGGRGNTITTGTEFAHIFSVLSTASANYSAILGGFFHTASGLYSAVIGGSGNVASGEGSVAVGGNQASASGYHSFAQGYGSYAQQAYAVTMGSYCTASARSARAVGEFCVAAGTSSWVSGLGTNYGGTGQELKASGLVSFNHSYNDGTVLYRAAEGNYSAILGGRNHWINANAHSSTILGGNDNTINTSVTGSTILGGSRITGTTSDTVYGINFNASGSIFSGGTNLLNIFSTGGGSNTYVTGGTFNNNLLTLTRNDNVQVNTLINNFSGITVNGDVISNNTTRISQSNITGATTVDTINTGTTDGAVWHYTVKSSSNLRAGTVTAGWIGSSVVYNESSTTDIGDTDAITISVIESGGYILFVVTPSSGNWTIKLNRLLI